MERLRHGVPGAVAWSLVVTCVLAVAPPAQGRVDDMRPRCQGKVATILGTTGDDRIVGTPHADVILGGDGMDRIFGGAGDDVICGGLGPSRVEEGEAVYQQLSGGAGDDVIVGGPDRDEIFDKAGGDLLIGRAGDDALTDYDFRSRGSRDVLRGGAGTDTLQARRGADVLLGGAGDDVLRDSLGDNELRGGAGNDRFEAGPGRDLFVGGAGVDLASYIFVLRRQPLYEPTCDPLTVSLSTGVARGRGFGTDALRGIEDLAGGSGPDVLVGDEGPNAFFLGTPCYDVLVQNESVTGGSGEDRIDFESSRYDPNTAEGPVDLDLAAGTASLRSINRTTNVEVRVAIDSVENAMGTSYADVMRGDDGPNELSGGPGQFDGDSIDGRAGDDLLVGSNAPDTLYGGAGNDTLRGLDGDDRLDGGPDVNRIEGGRGTDSCQNPTTLSGALSCEA